MLEEDVVCEPAAMDSEDVLFLLYTSGSTGKPKGLVHTQAGYLLYAALTHRVNTKHNRGAVSILSHRVSVLTTRRGNLSPITAAYRGASHKNAALVLAWCIYVK